jgi:UDP-glucose 4-epimerase
VIDEDLAPSYEGKRVLITGGLGFIGSNLARALLRLGSEVVLVDSLIPEYGGNLHNIEGLNGRLRVNISDVRDEYSMRYLVQGHDVLFNLAGQTSHLDSMSNPFSDLEINARSQLSILEACRHHNPEIVVVFASTRQIYGRPHYLPVDEQHPLAPVDVNGINKIAGEYYHMLYGDVYDIPTCVLRLTNTYGPRMRVKDARQTFLGFWFREILDGKRLKIFGDGEQKRDFNFVDDVVRALLLVATRSEAYGRIYNLGSDEVVNLTRLAEIVVEQNGAGGFDFVPFPPSRKAIDIGDYYADFSLIRSELGWEPRVGLADGVGQALAFYRDKRDSYWRDDA